MRQMAASRDSPGFDSRQKKAGRVSEFLNLAPQARIIAKRSRQQILTNRKILTIT